ncbi:MAG: M1 family metallopeptidase [Lysobacteraceae bacterium]
MKTNPGLALFAVLAFSLCGQTSRAQDASASDATAETTTDAATADDAPVSLDVADIALASADARAIRVASAADAWGGPRQPGTATLSDRVVAYDIDVELDPVEHTLDGKQKLTWRNRSDVVVGSVYLHLYLNAFRSEGSTYFTESRERGFAFRSDVDTEEGDWGYTDLTKVEQNGAAVSWEFVHPDGGPETDLTVVRFDLPEPVLPGASTTLDIDFHAQLPRVVARTGYYDSFHLIGQWFPKIAVLELPGERGATAPRWNAHEMHLHSEFFADFGSYDVRITVPEAFTVGATGKLIGEPTVADGKRTSRYVQHDVIDFAWTAFDRYGELTGNWSGEGSPEVTVRVLYPTEYEDNAAPVLKATQDSLAYFSKTLGAYPYDTVTAVIPPYNAGEAGGMEYPTFFTADSVDDYEPDTIGAWALDFVTIHEFGHGYFMGILASNEFEEPMLDEGLNEYWNQRMMRERQQDIRIDLPPLKWFGIKPSLASFDMERLGARLAEGVDGMGENAWNRYSSGSYGSVYSRTATTMRDLEDLVGREQMEAAFKLYYERWKFRHPSVADLRDALIEGTGQPDIVNRVFESQVYGVERVDDYIVKVDSMRQKPLLGLFEDDNGEIVETTEESRDEAMEDARKAWKEANPEAKEDAGPYPWISHVVVRRDGDRLPAKLKVVFEDDSEEVIEWDDNARWKRFSFSKPVKIRSAQLDPDNVRYLDMNRLDNSRTREPNRSAVRQFVAATASVAQTFFALMVNL